jgi:hypothetical protein
LHCSVFIAVLSTHFKPGPLLPGRRLGGSRRLSSNRRLSSHRRLSSSSAAGCLTILVVFTLRHCIVMIDWRSALDSNSIADCRFPGVGPGLVKKGMKIREVIGGSWHTTKERYCKSTYYRIRYRIRYCVRYRILKLIYDDIVVYDIVSRYIAYDITYDIVSRN